jgi:endonuclease IV
MLALSKIATKILAKVLSVLIPLPNSLKHPAVANAPLILETPGMEPEHGEEIALLKKLRG